MKFFNTLIVFFFFNINKLPNQYEKFQHVYTDATTTLNCIVQRNLNDIMLLLSMSKKSKKENYSSIA